MLWEAIQESRTSITKHINCKLSAGKCTLCVFPFLYGFASIFLNRHFSMVHNKSEKVHLTPGTILIL